MKFRVKNNAHVRFEIGGHLASRVIDGLDDLHDDLQAFARFSFFDQFFDQGNTREKHTLTGAGHMGK